MCSSLQMTLHNIMFSLCHFNRATRHRSHSTSSSGSSSEDSDSDSSDSDSDSSASDSNNNTKDKPVKSPVHAPSSSPKVGLKTCKLLLNLF